MSLADTSVQIFDLLTPDCKADDAYLDDVARSKRFLEWWVGDPEFRARLLEDPLSATREAGLTADPEEIRALWDDDPEVQARPLTPSAQRYRAFITEKLRWRGTLRDLGRSPHPGFDAWRTRQINRCWGQLGLRKADGIIHAPVSFELCRGCSVGCWFCGIGARKLTEVWPYDDANGALWRGTLTALYEVIGSSAARGFCYWATDPLDNPDYERFCVDFHEILGRFPQTTTAQPLRDPARMRTLLALSRGRGCEVNRFSVLSKSILRKIFETYTARELLHVELVEQMDGSADGKAFAGRARERGEKFQKATSNPIPDDTNTSTIACVSGFLVRMPARTIELVSPCNADERWPLGYRVHDRRTFDGLESLRACLADMTAALPVTLAFDAGVALRRDLHLERTADGFTLTSPFIRHTFNSARYPAMRELGETLAEGGTAGDIALAVERARGVDLHVTLHALNKLFGAGFFDDEPAFSQEADRD